MSSLAEMRVLLLNKQNGALEFNFEYGSKGFLFVEPNGASYQDHWYGQRYTTLEMITLVYYPGGLTPNFHL